MCVRHVRVGNETRPQTLGPPLTNQEFAEKHATGAVPLWIRPYPTMCLRSDLTSTIVRTRGEHCDDPREDLLSRRGRDNRSRHRTNLGVSSHPEPARRGLPGI